MVYPGGNPVCMRSFEKPNWTGKMNVEKLKRFAPIILLVILGIFVSISVCFSPADNLVNWFSTDDAFYYFNVAKNVTQGSGFSFDGMNLTNGYHPLWMLVCIAVFWLAKYSLILPLRVIIVIAGLLNAGSAILIYLILSRKINKLLSFAVAVFWAVLPIFFEISTTQGLETGISIFFLLLFLHNLQLLSERNTKPKIKDLLLLGFLAALAILGRLDNVFYVAIPCIFYVFNVKAQKKQLLFDFLAIFLSANLAWVIHLEKFSSDVLNFSVFPLLLLGLIFKPIILFIFNGYKETASSKKITGLLRIAVRILATLLIFVGILYAINALDISIRFTKTVIFFDAAISGFLLLINHLSYAFLPHPENSQQTREKPSITIKQKLSESVRKAFFVGLPVVVFIGIYMTLNKIFFHSFFPVSGKVKHLWSFFGNTVYAQVRNVYDVFGLGQINGWGIITKPIAGLAKSMALFFNLEGKYSELNLSLIFLFLLMVILIVILIFLSSNHRSKFDMLLLPALLVGSLLRISFYNQYGYVAAREWYWVVENLIVLLFCGLLVGMLYERLASRKVAKTIFSVVIVVTIALSVYNGLLYGMKLADYSIPQGQQDRYLAEIKSLESATPDGSVIGMTGSGMVGYFIQDRTIVNLDGLINSQEYYLSLQNGTTAHFLHDLGLEYVWGNEYLLLESDPYEAFFKTTLQKVEPAAAYGDHALYRFVYDPE
jgi:hypothetical protein